MAKLVRWDPLRDMVSLREAMDRLFAESFVSPRSWSAPTEEGVATLALDVFEDDNDVTVQASVPGVKPEDIELSITGDVLTIKGETREQKEERQGDYHVRERRCGAFQRSITLPAQIDADKADAKFKDGVLTLTLPKREEVKPKTIKIKTQ
jgi:HSP20 family protein